MDITKSKIVVTGAASGLGAACAGFLSQSGAQVAGFDISDAVEASADALNFFAHRADVTDENSLKMAVDRAAAHMGGVNVVVNCAGIVIAEKTLGRNGPHGLEGFKRTLDINLAEDAIGQDRDGNDVYLRDIWPTSQEVAELVEQTVTREAFQTKYADVFKGDDKWQSVQTTDAETYDWPAQSTYIQNPPYFQGMSKEPGKITNLENAKVLALLGDMVTTDHISPAGSFKDSTPAGQYLIEREVPLREFNSYGSHRGNHEVMMRGTFANIRIKNEMLDGVEGGYTKGPDGAQTSIFEAAMAHQAAGTPLIIFAGEQYGAGSSRDWAAKGTALLGVKAVVAESFERIHRSNLVGMGVIPFEFTGGVTRKSLGLTGNETVSISGLDTIEPLQEVPCTITKADGQVHEIMLKCRIDTAIEIEYIEHGGVLHYVLRDLAKAG